MLLFSDGFDSYSATADLTSKWTYKDANVGFNPTGGVNGGGALVHLSSTSNNPTTYYQFPINSSATKLYISVWVKIPSVTVFSGFIAFYKGTTATSAFRITTGGLLNFDNLSSNFDLSWTKLDDNKWHHLEIAINQSTTAIAGNIKVWIDGVLRANASNNTINSTAKLSPDRFHMILPRGSATSFIDDLIVWDDQTSDGFSTSPMGPRFIETIRPDGAGSITTMTPLGTASNWEAVDDLTLDGDATFVYGTTGGDLYSFGNLPASVNLVSGLTINTVSKVDISGSFPLFNRTKNGGITANSIVSVVNSTTYRTLQTAQNIDPATSAAWTTSGLANAEFGLGFI